MSGAIRLLPLYAFMARTGTTVFLPLPPPPPFKLSYWSDMLHHLEIVSEQCSMFCCEIIVTCFFIQCKELFSNQIVVTVNKYKGTVFTSV
jgi:hypothetical protein